MKKSELRKLIKEELLKEFDTKAREKVILNYYRCPYDLMISIKDSAKLLGHEDVIDDIIDYLYERIAIK